MRRSFYGTLLAAFSAALLLFAAGCAEDPRYSAQTQYLGGGYGNAPAGAPQDSVSYWDGDGIEGKPSITISLREQRAYFYKSGVLVGVSQLSTGREGLNTPYGHFSIIQKDIPELLVHASPQLGVVRLDIRHTIGMFDGDKDDEIQPIHGASDPRQPGVEVESLGVAMGDQVGKDVRRAAIEDQVLPVLGEQFHRSLQLQFEILEGGHLREFVPFLFEEIVGLRDRCVGWEKANQLLDERRLSGSVRS